MLTPLFAVLLLPISFAPVPAVPDESEPGKPTPVFKGTNFLIHTLRIDSTVVVLHTAVHSGEMKILLKSSVSSFMLGQMAIDRILYQKIIVAGVAADAERVYVVMCQASATVEDIGRPQQPKYGEAKNYQLVVFRAADGKKIITLDMKEGDFPKEAPKDTTGKGDLTLRDNGVSCYGVVITIKGETATQKYEKKK